MRKPLVGETLYVLNVGNAARHTPQVLTPVTVTKVGRKYFTVTTGRAWYSKQPEFSIETWRENSKYSPTMELYESEQKYADYVESRKLLAELKHVFKYDRCLDLPLESLREIHRIVNGAR